MKKAKALFAAIKEARELLKTLGFQAHDIKTLMSGDGVSFEVDSESSLKLIKDCEKAGLSVHEWVSGGGHGYRDQDMATVRI